MTSVSVDAQALARGGPLNIGERWDPHTVRDGSDPAFGDPDPAQVVRDLGRDCLNDVGMPDPVVAGESSHAPESTDLAKWPAGRELDVCRPPECVSHGDGNIGLGVREMNVHQIELPHAEQQEASEDCQIGERSKPANVDAWQAMNANPVDTTRGGARSPLAHDVDIVADARSSSAWSCACRSAPPTALGGYSRVQNSTLKRSALTGSGGHLASHGGVRVTDTLEEGRRRRRRDARCR